MTANQNFQTMIDSAQEAIAPMFKYNEFAAKAFERVARKQWELAGACVDLGIEQMNSLASAKDVQTVLTTQQSLVTRWNETVSKGSMELMEIVRDNQSEALDLFTKQTKETAQKATKKAS
jgi:phasin family protein